MSDEKIEQGRRELKAKKSRLDRCAQWDLLRPLLQARFEQTNSLDDLREIIRNDHESIRVVPSNCGEIVTYVFRLDYLGIAFSDLYNRTRAVSDSAKALFFRRYAVALCAKSLVHVRSVMMAHLASSLLSRAERKGDVQIFDESLAYAQAAAEAYVSADSARLSIFKILGNVLRQRYKRLGEMDDLQKAINIEDQIIHDLPLGIDPTAHYQNLAFSLSLRYDVEGNPSDLDRAIYLGLESLRKSTLTPEFFADCSSNVAHSYLARFERSWDSGDIEKAAAVLRKASALLPPNNSRQAKICTDMAFCLLKSYEESNRLEDLEAAIEVAQGAVHLPENNRHSKSCLNGELGHLFSLRYKRLSRPEDSSESLRYYTAAAAICPRDDPALRMILDNISNLYDDMYLSTRNIEYLQTSILKSKEALALPSPLLSSPIWLNMASKYLQLYLANQSETKNLDESMKCIRRCLAQKKQWNGRVWGQVLLSAGIALDVRYNVLQKPEDLEEALKYLLQCWSLQEAPPMIRVGAVRTAWALLGAASRWEEAWKYLREAVKLIPLLCPATLDRKDKQDTISKLSGLSAEACSAALAVGKVSEALEVLEQGRGIIISSAHAAIGELPELKSQHENLYLEFEKLRSLLNTISPSDGPSIVLGIRKPTDHSRNVSEILDEFNRLLGQIRNQPGFENFLMPISVKRMQELAQDGAVVVLNGTKLRNDAIIVQKDCLKAIHLPDSTPYGSDFSKRLPNISSSLMDNAAHGGKMSYQSRNATMRGVLNLLWWHVGGPVCQELGLTNDKLRSHENLRTCRIHWMTTGTFSRLPVHAAGIYVGQCHDILPKKAISSYIASFKILEYAQKQSQNLSSRQMRGILVNMSNPKDKPRLKKVFLGDTTEEVSAVMQTGSRILWQELKRPSASEFMCSISDCSYLHVDSHGVSDPKDPSRSHLVLWKQVSDRFDDPQNVDRLTVTEIAQGLAKIPVLAFLAACCTIDTRSPTLVDEGLQIGNAFQLAGFPHVIGTLWPVYSFACELFAKTFYPLLMSLTANEPLTNDYIAIWAQIAAAKLIKDYMNEPLLWACFVHMGP